MTRDPEYGAVAPALLTVFCVYIQDDVLGMQLKLVLVPLLFQRRAKCLLLLLVLLTSGGVP